eukprot:CAMPEP_0118876358 /NCGR_PEP_ID=MMETSP1163-20130328/17082_1 /TAXON_ID=124430 /ORGANISM="Phaeomonas parva, Strain CCMP2877" /LENGTH=209 /DNA_ID=CAMNT_0006811965 /DNA_START=321 /DNA_END=952 /DNA_ORIENTATION=+
MTLDKDRQKRHCPSNALALVHGEPELRPFAVLALDLLVDVLTPLLEVHVDANFAPHPEGLQQPPVVDLTDVSAHHRRDDEHEGREDEVDVAKPGAIAFCDVGCLDGPDALEEPLRVVALAPVAMEALTRVAIAVQAGLPLFGVGISSASQQYSWQQSVVSVSSVHQPRGSRHSCFVQDSEEFSANVDAKSAKKIMGTKNTTNVAHMALR